MHYVKMCKKNLNYKTPNNAACLTIQLLQNQILLISLTTQVTTVYCQLGHVHTDR